MNRIPKDIMITRQDLIYWLDRPLSNEDMDLIDYIVNRLENFYKLDEENSQLNKIVNKIKKLRSANTHVENIYYAEGVLLNEPYCDIEDVDNEELLDILQGDE